MAGERCSCGFAEAEAGDETVADHLLEMFAPEDCRGNDGLPHLEITPDLTCSCGLVAATARALDAHFLAVFTPAGSVGPDGVSHKVNAAVRPVPCGGDGGDAPAMRG